MRVTIELKQADADGRGGDILTTMGMKRSDVTPNHFRALVLSEPDDPHWDDRDLALPYIEALRDEDITPRRVAVKTRSIPYNMMSSSAEDEALADDEVEDVEDTEEDAAEVSASDEGADRAHRESRLKSDWVKVAKEALEVELVKGAFYGFGSELAVLRLFAYYNKATRNKNTSFGFSANMKAWYFALEYNQ